MKIGIQQMSKFMIVIFGGSGDLTKRKLIPALFTLFKKGTLENDFFILGVGRTSYTDATYRSYIEKEMETYIKKDPADASITKEFLAHLFYLSMDPAAKELYGGLATHIDTLTGEKETNNILYYLATPPSLYGLIPLYLQSVHLNRKGARIIIEKPFGSNLAECVALNKTYASVFHENQIYRIDHYLGKETVQDILAFRFANSIFEPIWNRNYIDYVEITAVENIGIELRGAFYDSVGALRDMVQNHLIQLVALAAMEPPAIFDAHYFRDEIVKVYASLVPLQEEDFNEHIIRGQYTASKDAKGYREEQHVDPESRTETFIAMKLAINNWRWQGVPFFIRTGKQMPTKVSEIVIHFKQTPHSLFNCGPHKCQTANTLIIRIQPNEGIIFKIGVKEPGSNFTIKQVDMDFSYNQIKETPITDAYSKLIEDCIHGNPTLFTRSDAVEASWCFFNPIVNYWEKHPDSPLHGYPAGTWGPLESELLVVDHDAKWTNPCKNLTDSDKYCEL